ncbi:BppU family phage baseplate upper protein [Lactococcus lactis]|uniref:BppU family phage baseplate upper protein n=1 Tax=Lactococcus lactis TaxID=1358 RepID=UPI00241820D9|nr:BppU family phage baseplate upper protein [Lactococcus lactis]MDG4966252.1 BppU family phage baseplate upper protein [Lactococcus lactis]
MQERLKLDLSQKTSVSQGIATRVNDGGIHSIDVTALNYGDVFDLTDYKVIFEITTSVKTIAFDPVNAKVTDAKNGEFTYTIPKEITGVAGIAERAYFAFEKGDKRITSADISLTILQIIDITAEEAKSYISEYNKLVNELKELQDKAINEMTANLSETNKQITVVESNLKKLEDSIAEYQKTVKDAADEAIKKVEGALEEINSKDFYTKDESDKKLATQKQAIDSHVNNKSNPHAVTASQVGAYTKTESDSKLTDLSKKAFVNKGNLASGTDLNSVTDTGFYRIGGLVGGTDILNVPSEVSGIRFYAFLTVIGSLQELTVYSPKQDTTWTYSRSISGSPAIWSPWSKTVMADDSGKVTIKDLVASNIALPNDTDGWVTLQNLHYKKRNELVSFWFDFTATTAGTTRLAILPAGFIPPNDVMHVITNWATTAAGSKVLQITGLNSNINVGAVEILNAVANTRYTGHFTFSV